MDKELEWLREKVILLEKIAELEKEIVRLRTPQPVYTSYAWVYPPSKSFPQPLGDEQVTVY